MCQISNIAETENGKIYLCTSCKNKIGIMFGNICQSFDLDKYIEFTKNITNIRLDNYYFYLLDENCMYIKSSFDDLYFVMNKNEIIELQLLIKKAKLKIDLILNYLINTN